MHVTEAKQRARDALNRMNKLRDDALAVEELGQAILAAYADGLRDSGVWMTNEEARERAKRLVQAFTEDWGTREPGSDWKAVLATHISGALMSATHQGQEPPEPKRFIVEEVEPNAAGGHWRKVCELPPIDDALLDRLASSCTWGADNLDKCKRGMRALLKELGIE